VWNTTWDNTAYCLNLSVEDLSPQSNKIEAVGLRKCPYYHYLAKICDVTITNIFLRACPISWREHRWHRYLIWYEEITVTLCIEVDPVGHFGGNRLSPSHPIASIPSSTSIAPLQSSTPLSYFLRPYLPSIPC